MIVVALVRTTTDGASLTGTIGTSVLMWRELVANGVALCCNQRERR